MNYGIQTNDSKVFMFHQVTDDKNAWRDENCAITLTGFENFLERIKRQNVEIASIERLEENIRKKRIYITFDDVYEDAVCNAFPILIKEGIPFCIFVSTELIGQSEYNKGTTADVGKRTFMYYRVSFKVACIIANTFKGRIEKRNG